ncbi:Nucleotide-binding universal stress protein, UspA family [Geodermatophilus siccatus]|uniref:Nucleotide-binding universal stress protein, UspA family n=1 Tax=Geodermatophilus siccatus TaxID=1137991 RepID=A0A1G9NMY0_9ACTN|nr:universal stress protein [Geodermatophilus siccatus]SDL87749.1 Nucleotide-binding universal stress protein, UspA family [Geodermatophilus siccatus]
MTGEATGTGTAGRADDGGGAPGSARVVVGVDGSPGAFAALVWALAEAARSGADVEVVSAFPVGDHWNDPLLIDPRRVETLRSDTEARARAFVARAMSDPAVTAVPRAAAVEVSFTIAAGEPAEHLVHLARGARLLVVGSRGRGGVRSTLLGSVALHCSTHAPCAVVVVHAPLQPAAARVVVGFDDSPVARTALARAAEEAGRRGAALEVVAAYQPVVYWSDVVAVVPPPFDESVPEFRGRVERLVAEVLGAPLGQDVSVVAEVGPAGEVLVRRAEGAELLVVGSRSRSRLAGMVLGSVALHCVVHASCPVLVVRPEPSGVVVPEQAAGVPARA